MSLAGFKKQINKANQFVSEKMGSAEGTKMEDEFVDLERKTDVMTNLVTQLLSKTKEYLQPNPTVRAKIYMHMASQGSKYPQTEGALGDVMLKAGHDLDPQLSDYASALLDVGSALIEVAEAKDIMDQQVHESFLMPLHEMDEKQLKEIAGHRKKLQGRRLDYDCKKRKGNKIAVEEVKMAQYKFEESKEICQEEMTKLMGNEVERIHQLSQLVCGMLEHHKKSADTLERLLLLLNRRVHEASKRSGNAEKTEKPATTENTQSKSEVSAKGTNSLANDSESSQNQKNEATGSKPSCRARCEYKAQKDEEISFSEGQVIMLSGKIDNEWFEGTLDGKFGKFPAKHVEILVDIP
ncbi:Endophilin-A2 [Acropora cervicornis]|uniref:Endophilin-A2 n=1 Tax=Acropora cervicornis TaxID=6130 RepID=A0AAD9QRG9_ACRCE|nr:Endophilin-A2 [Acropora cervicornis]